MFQVLFSSLCSKFAVYRRKLQWFFFDSTTTTTVTLTCYFWVHRAGSQLKIQVYREEAFSILQRMKKTKYSVPIHYRFLFSPCSIKSKLFINPLSLHNRICGFVEKILSNGIIVISEWLCWSLLKWTPTGALVELLFRTVFKWSTIRFSADLFDCPKYCILHF